MPSMPVETLEVINNTFTVITLLSKVVNYCVPVITEEFLSIRQRNKFANESKRNKIAYKCNKSSSVSFYLD